MQVVEYKMLSLFFFYFWRSFCCSTFSLSSNFPFNLNTKAAGALRFRYATVEHPVTQPLRPVRDALVTTGC